MPSRPRSARTSFSPTPTPSNFCPGRFSPTSCSPTKSTARRRRRSRRCSRRWRNTRPRSTAFRVPLPEHFFVIATQNPIEYEGTFPLPEAQTDRFLFKIKVDYPTPADELTLLQQPPFSGKVEEIIQPRATAEDFAVIRQEIEAVTIDQTIYDYTLRLLTASRQSPQLALGASPARRPRLDPRRARAGLAARTRLRHAGRHQGTRLPDPAPSPRPQGGDGNRGHDGRAGDRPASRLGRSAAIDYDSRHHRTGGASPRNRVVCRRRVARITEASPQRLVAR